jgi:DNA transformation protein
MVSEDFLGFVVEQLSLLGPVRARRMFGGAGLYSGETIFAIVADDVLYLKVDALSRADYEREGMKPFRPYRDRATAMPYFEVPAFVLEDAVQLCDWGARAMEAGRRGPRRPTA